jgi:protein SCO1/2
VKRVRIAAWLAVAFALGFIAWPLTTLILHEEEKFDALFIGGPFAMTEHNGRAVTDKDYAGKAKAIFFGFTYCPDVCPTTLARLTVLMEKLGPDAEKLQVILVSVDPGRDTPEVLKAYLAAFDPRIIGLTGTTEQLAKFAKSYRVFYERIPGPDGDYTLNHSAGIYLFKASGELQGTVDAHEPDETAIRKLKLVVN